MNYRTIAPPPSLARYISCLWSLEAPVDDMSQRVFTVMSSGFPGLIFQRDPAVFTGFGGERLPQLFIFGQATHYGNLQAKGRIQLSGINFRPTALKNLFNLNANELRDEHINIHDLIKTSLTEQLLHADSLEEQANCLFTCFNRLAGRRQDSGTMLTYAIEILQRGGNIPHLLNKLNLSERSLERLFQSYIGISPKLYIRIMRFQRSIALLKERSSASLTDIAYSLDYFDQSHFIHDFKRFSGVSPKIYKRDAVERMPGFPERRP